MRLGEKGGVQFDRSNHGPVNGSRLLPTHTRCRRTFQLPCIVDTHASPNVPLSHPQPETLPGRGLVHPDPTLDREEDADGPEAKGTHQANDIIKEREEDAHHPDGNHHAGPEEQAEGQPLRWMEASVGTEARSEGATSRVMTHAQILDVNSHAHHKRHTMRLQCASVIEETKFIQRGGRARLSSTLHCLPPCFLSPRPKHSSPP